MKSTMEILTKLQENSQKNHDEIFTRLYRYLLRPDIYFIAYQHLYSNKGAGTKGVNDDTADGFSEQYVTAIIEALRTGSYEPKPVRRTYIQKKNGKLRPLGLPVFADKLVQEAIRMILEAIYEPIFSIYSHGFRPGRSCHTALAMIKHEFTGAKWFIEGDIKGCFDNIDHSTLIGVLNRKIKDARFLNLIRMFLKSGYMEDWDFHETYSGCPQGGIISPILANVYLNELDRYITQLKKEFDHGYNPRNFTEEYNAIRHKRDALHEKIKKAEGTMREQLIAQHKQLTKQLFRTPAKACTDKRLKYVRYADDFLIAVNGTREECEAIKAKLTDFVRDTLKMELSQEKTLITHSNTPARFLGFDVRVRRDASVKRSGKRKMRTMNNKVELNIPLKDKVETYLLSHSIAKRDGKRLIPIHRPILLNRTDLEIVMIYNAELRGLCNYYAIASNFNKLVYFGYLMEYSCLKTLANKHRSRIAKVRYEYRDGTGAWGVPYETKKGKRRMMFAKYSDCKGKDLTEKVPDLAYRYSHNTTSFEERLKAKVCEFTSCYQCFKRIVPKYCLYDNYSIQNICQFTVFTNYFSGIPFTYRFYRLRFTLNQIIQISRAVFGDFSIRMTVIVQHLHFQTSFIGVFVFLWIFIDVKNNSTVGFWRHFPIYFQVKVFVFRIGYDVATLTIFGGFGVKMQDTVFYFPPSTHGSFAVSMPTSCCFSVKNWFKSFLCLYGLSDYQNHKCCYYFLHID